MIKPIQESLDSIISHLSLLDRPVVQRFQNGLGAQALEGHFEKLPIELPQEIRELYLGMNGTKINKGDVLDDLHFFPGFYLLSFEDAVNSYNAFKDDTRWRSSWFPLFANGGGDFYAVSCESGVTLQGEIIGFMLGKPDQVAEFESLSSLLATMEACYAEGIFYASAEGYLEADDLKQAEVAKRFNPHLKLYQ